jgi:pimeloyl-ACP methyl ester carboxylesterase
LSWSATTTTRYTWSTRSRLAVVPGTSHGLLADKPELCNTMIIDFLTEATESDDR